MIQIICKSESYTYNAYHILKAFYPSQEVSCKTDEEASNYVTVQLPDGQEIFAETENLQTEKKRQTDLNLYDQLEKITGEPLAWGVLCVLIVKIIHPLIYKVLTMIPLVLGIVVMACLAVGLLADLYVTASGILKMNRRLEAMEKIAAELKELSDKVGENIYENVMEGMEFREEKKARIEELKAKYEEMAENRTKVGERLVKAFPKMQVGQHKEIFEELRERIKRSK